MLLVQGIRACRNHGRVLASCFLCCIPGLVAWPSMSNSTCSAFTSSASGRCCSGIQIFTYTFCASQPQPGLRQGEHGPNSPCPQLHPSPRTPCPWPGKEVDTLAPTAFQDPQPLHLTSHSLAPGVSIPLLRPSELTGFGTENPGFLHCSHSRLLT